MRCGRFSKGGKGLLTFSSPKNQRREG